MPRFNSYLSSPGLLGMRPMPKNQDPPAFFLLVFVKLESATIRTEEEMFYSREWEGYLPDHPHLRVGVDIELADDPHPGRQWRIISVADEFVEQAFIKDGWSNNI